MKIFLKKKMSEITSFKIGGIADVIAEPKDIKELVELIKFLRDNNYKYYILGNGTNILVSDKGIRGCVVHLSSSLSKIRVTGTKIEAEAGASLYEIANVAFKNKLTGLEELSGIPGTVGGAVAMNAGAYDNDMSKVVSSVNVIDESGKVVKLTKDLLEFSYRKSSIIENDYIVTSVTFNLQEGDKKNIMDKMEKYKTLRWNKQPLDKPSAGSIFKRPEGGYYASLLIQDSNLKGENIGGAFVSEKHAGFIVNDGTATANDVYKLIQKIQDTVKVYYNVLLEPEIKFWGKF